MPICNVCRQSVEPERDRLWVKDGFEIVRCPACGLVFRAERPTVTGLQEIYALDYFRDDIGGESQHGYADYVHDEHLHRLNARRRLAALGRRFPSKGRLLDVGCAAGFFVDEASRAGWDACGVDISKEMTAWARGTLDVQVVEGTIADVDVRDGDLDAVTMWDYIEHAIDAAGDVATAARRLRPGGVLALSTGDVDSVVARVSGRRWHLLTPRHHNFFFSRKTLRMLLTRAGFDLLSTSYEPSRYSLQHVVYKLDTLVELPWVRRGAQKIAESRLSRAAIPLNLFDIVTIVARKRPAAGIVGQAVRPSAD